MREELVSVQTTAGMLEAEILRGLLESAGILVHLSHEAAAGVYGLGIGPVAQVEVMVPAALEAEARQILEDYRADRLDSDASTKPPVPPE